MFDLSLIITAAFLAGVLNSIAGGGSFLTLPALVYIGVPIIPANATSTVSVFPGYISGTVGFMAELKAFDRRQLVIMILLSVIGGVLGALLLLVTPSHVFNTVVPWLLLFATLLFALGDKINKLVPLPPNIGSDKTSNRALNKGWIPTLLVTIYGGYFNGGLGIILLALFSALGMTDIKLMSGLKNALSAILSASSVITFALAGIIYWNEAMLMMIAATIGGYCGAILVRQLPQTFVRYFIIVIGAVITIAFFLR
jgi:uncharacterized membrane protein YfcA